MTVLLMRLAGPLQGWGYASKFNRRDTEREPTRSGVVGLAAAALGRRRDDDVSDLAGLGFGVRVDQPGRIIRDFHTARMRNAENSFVTERYYLADAVFVAGLEGDAALLAAIDAALSRPAFPLYLGRRSCPPTGRISLGLVEAPLADALRDAPWQAAAWHRRRTAERVELTGIRDAGDTDVHPFVRRDLPLSYASTHRRHGFRKAVADARMATVENPDARSRRVGDALRMAGPATRLDPFASKEADNVSIED